MRSVTKVLLLAGVALPSFPAFAQSNPVPANAGLEEIVVTAQKREERLQDVPVAVSALSKDSIQEKRIQSALDLTTLVPSLSVTPSVGGNQPLFVLRGALAANAANFTSDAAVSQYIDGVYLGVLAGSLSDVTDIERIEVIRGPAGTLFGTNATGGAINYITSRPKGEFHVRQEVSYSRFNSFRSRTRVDLPEWNGLSASLTYLHNKTGSDLRNVDSFTFDTSLVAADGTTRATTVSRPGEVMTDAIHAALRYKPVDGLVLDYSYDYSKRRDSGPGAQIIGANDGSTILGTIGFLAGLEGRTLADYVSPTRLTRLYDTQTPGINTTQSHYFSAEYAANEFFTVKNIASWRGRKQNYRLNGLDAAGGFNASGSLLQLLNSGIQETSNQFSNETQFIVDTEKLDLTAGLFYYTRRTQPGSSNGGIYLFAPFPAATSSGADYVIPSQSIAGDEKTFARTRQAAGYAQATYHITPELDITGGVRFAQDSKQIFDGPSGRTFDYSKGTWTYLGNLSYKPSEGVMVYAKFTTGFVAGGPTLNVVSAVDPVGGATFRGLVTSGFLDETAKSWELGVKADLFDKKLRTNLALFRVDYKNLQIASFLPATVTAPSGASVPVGIFSVANAGGARDTGVEYEITAVPLQGLTLSASGAYNDFKYVNAPAFLGAPVLRPKFTANLSAEYQVPVGNDMRLSLQGDANYRSSVIVGSGYPFSTNPTVNPTGAALNSIIKQPELWTLNARVSLKDVEFGPVKGQISLWGRNLTNKQQLLGAANLGFTVSGTFAQPATYGVDLNIDF